MIDFFQDQSDPHIFLNDEYARSLSESVNNIGFLDSISDAELKKFIVDDILSITMWEKQFKKKLKFGFDELLSFIEKQEHAERIITLLAKSDINDFINIYKNKNDDYEIRIKDDQFLLQDAMDYAEVWYSGFLMPDDVEEF